MSKSLTVCIAVFCATDTALAVNAGIDHSWVPMGLIATCAVAMFGLFVFNLRSLRHGSREAREDHRSGSALDPGARAANDASPSAGTSPGVEIPRETSTEPIAAWKVARLLVDESGRGVRLASLNQRLTHPVEGTAWCAKAFPFGGWPMENYHDAPHLDCHCGFYAWKTRADAIKMIGSTNAVLLEVELFGTVIQHEQGYRAQKQRVLGVYIGSRCNGFMCHTPAQWIDFPVNEISAGNAWCDAHKPEAGRITTVQEVANYLRCETNWAEL